MVNEEKVKIMNRLAMYEHGEGRKYLPVSRYYRSDYIGLALIRNFFLVTIGYVLGLAGWKKSTGGRKKEIRSGEMQEDIENDSFT